MDRSSRSELLKTVEAQQEKIKKYEGKLRGMLFHTTYDRDLLTNYAMNCISNIN